MRKMPNRIGAARAWPGGSWRPPMLPPAQKVRSALATRRAYSAGRRMRTNARPTRVRSRRGSGTSSSASPTGLSLTRDRPSVQGVELRAAPGQTPRPMSSADTDAAQTPRRAFVARERRARAAELLGLFAWHKDAPLVARALRMTLDELQAELDTLGIRRKAFRLVQTAPGEVPRASPLPGVASGPPVRRRVRPGPRPEPTEAAPAQPPPEAAPTPEPVRGAATAPASRTEDVAAQATRLRTLLGEVGPRRRALAQRLGARGRPLAMPVLLARFRAAGLERELGQRERDLVRALYARHRGGDRKVAKDLDLAPQELADLLRERGLAREIAGLRERYRAEARSASWPAAQLGNLALRRGWLEDLGIYAELARLAKTRASAAWEKAARAKDPGQALRRELAIGPAEARVLRELFSR